jgi:hypothetical protein
MSSDVEEAASSQTTRWVVRYSCPFSWPVFAFLIYYPIYNY